MRIGREDIEHWSRLARLGLRPEEADSFAQELGRILGYVENLRTIDVTGDEPLLYATDQAPLREDEVAPSLERAAALGDAPATPDGHFAVPFVVESEEKLRAREAGTEPRSGDGSTEELEAGAGDEEVAGDGSDTGDEVNGDRA